LDKKPRAMEAKVMATYSSRLINAVIVQVDLAVGQVSDTRLHRS
jgi:hypothetical protein